MSDMEDFIDVRVTRRGSEIAEGCYKLPVTIGRGEHNSIRIGHSPQDMTISRTHAIIQRAAGGLLLVDKSANGTVYRGKRIRQGNAILLGVADSFEIFDFKVSIGRVQPNPSIPVLFEAHVLVDGYRKGKPFLIGEMLLLCFKSSKGYRFDQAPQQADLRTIFTRHRLHAEYPFAAVADVDGEGRLVTQTDSDQPPITVNRKPASRPEHTLRERDVVEIGNIRIEIVQNPTPMDNRSFCRFFSRLQVPVAAAMNAAPLRS
jgi:pSer/pThr/pTyr-binding forkhead associated (FHA) protein